MFMSYYDYNKILFNGLFLLKFFYGLIEKFSVLLLILGRRKNVYIRIKFRFDSSFEVEDLKGLKL